MYERFMTGPEQALTLSVKCVFLPLRVEQSARDYLLNDPSAGTAVKT
jgi:hypothetical protein